MGGNKETITDLVKRYPEESAKIHGISYSGQMHGLVMIGADGKLIREMQSSGQTRDQKKRSRRYTTSQERIHIVEPC